MIFRARNNLNDIGKGFQFENDSIKGAKMKAYKLLKDNLSIIYLVKVDKETGKEKYVFTKRFVKDLGFYYGGYYEKWN